MIAETPIRSSDLTVYTKCSVNPPVSPSKIIGFVVTSITSSMVLKREVISISSISGFPLSVESHKEEIHIASNWSIISPSATIVFSAIRPVKPLCTSIVFTIGSRLINFFSLPLLKSGIASFSCICLSIFCITGFIVYGISINLPPYFERRSNILFLISFIPGSFQLSPCIM